jgi:hypothetical protein
MGRDGELLVRVNAIEGFTVNISLSKIKDMTLKVDALKLPACLS